jgi:hypothetical protein
MPQCRPLAYASYDILFAEHPCFAADLCVGALRLGLCFAPAPAHSFEGAMHLDDSECALFLYIPPRMSFPGSGESLPLKGLTYPCDVLVVV